MRYAIQEKHQEEERYCRYCGSVLRNKKSIVCPQCHTHNDVDARFCKHCAQQLTSKLVCSECGCDNDTDSCFCKRCGNKLNSAMDNMAAALEVPETRQVSIPVYQNCQVGETFKFGNFYYESNGEMAPLEWRVLRRGYNRMMVVATCGVDSRPYHDDLEGVTWENCSIRKWLNGNFYSKAFSEAERDCIITTMLNNDGNSEYDAPGGNATSDRVFLLSLREVNSLFSDNQDRCCRPTPYAVANGAWQFEPEKDEELPLKGYGWWWLRTPGGTAYTSGGSSCSACDIDYDGNVDAFGLSVGLGFGLIRPAMVLKI